MHQQLLRDKSDRLATLAAEVEARVRLEEAGRAEALQAALASQVRQCAETPEKRSNRYRCCQHLLRIFICVHRLASSCWFAQKREVRADF